MAELKTISTSLSLIDAKKENLRKSFEDLKKVSSFLSNFILTWTDLESHIDLLKSSIEERFKELQSKESQLQLQSPRTPPEQVKEQNTTSQKALVVTNSSNSVPDDGHDVKPRIELLKLCEKMDGKGLRKFINDNAKDRQQIRLEIPGALKLASDPAKMVLDALEGFYSENSSSKGEKDPAVSGFRRTCIMLLEELKVLGPQINANERERAKNLAVQWKGKLSRNGKNPLEALGVLQLLATFNLAAEFDAGEVLDLVVNIGRYRQAMELCRALGYSDRISGCTAKMLTVNFGRDTFSSYFHVEIAKVGCTRVSADLHLNLVLVMFKISKSLFQSTSSALVPKSPVIHMFMQPNVYHLVASIFFGGLILMVAALLVADLVQKLINNGKQLVAVKFVYEFGLAEKFQVVTLLKEYVKEAKKLAQKIRKEKKSSLQALNEATAKEVSALKSVIKHIEDYNLESEYPKGNLEKRVEQLEKQKAERKRSAPTASKPQQSQRIEQLEKQKAERKRPASAPASKPQYSQQKQPKTWQMSGNKRPRVADHSPVSVAPVAAVPTIAAGLWPERSAQYLSSSAGHYGLAGTSSAIGYFGSSAGLYSLGGTPQDFPGNPSPARSRLYSSEALTASGYNNTILSITVGLPVNDAIAMLRIEILCSGRVWLMPN
ncbi:Frigida-like, partial [Dillenia turbinata]